MKANRVRSRDEVERIKQSRLLPNGLDIMWAFLQFGGQKANVPVLKDLCEQLQTAMLQKTGGQEKYKKAHDVDFDEIQTLIECIAMEAMALWLSGTLDKLEDGEGDEMQA